MKTWERQSAKIYNVRKEEIMKIEDIAVVIRMVISQG